MNPSDFYVGGLDLELRTVRNIVELHRVFQSIDDQKSETCGPYSILKISRSLGVGKDLTEDILARLSGTTISVEEHELSIRLSGSRAEDLTPEVREKFYPPDMKYSENEAVLGTSAVGVQKAAEKIFGKNFDVVPLFGSRNGKINLDEEKFSKLTQVLWENIQSTGLNVILNMQMDLTISNSGLNSAADTMDFFVNWKDASHDDWHVGHFVVLAGLVRFHSPDGEQFFYILQDNYKKRGISGYLIQPASAVRKAIVRNDGNEGGLMVVYEISGGMNLRSRMEEIADSGIWDNGTPYLEQ